MPVKEGEQLQLTCIITGDPVVVQYTTDTTPIVYWITNDGRCDQIQITNKTIYSASCDRLNNKYIMDILNVSKSFNNRNITCEAQFHTFESHKVYDRILIEISPERKYNTFEFHKVYDRILIEVSPERKYNTFESHKVYDRIIIEIDRERKYVYDRILIEVNQERKYYHTFEYYEVYYRMHIDCDQERECHSFESHKVYDGILI